MITSRYLLKRLATYAVTIFASFTIVFVIPRLIPGNPIMKIVDQMISAGEIRGDEAKEMIESWINLYGLHEDLWVQYTKYLREVFLHGDLGISMAFFPTTVNEMVGRSLPWSVGLLVVCIVTSWVLGNILGAFVGFSSKVSKVQLAAVSAFLVLRQTPYYIFALVLALAFAYYIPIFPFYGGYSLGRIPSLSLSFILDVIYHSILPALAIITIQIGGHFISMRSLIVNIKGEDYINFAEAAGLKESTIKIKYAFRNALLPQVTGLGLSLGHMVSGSLLTEVVFSYPGIGWLYLVALQHNDYVLIQGLTLLIIFSVMTASLIIDLLYPLIDPRVTYEKR